MSGLSALVRLKCAVADAIDLCGGGDGAAATVERKRSVVYDWGNSNHPAFPPLECAWRLDRIAVAKGQRPEILHRLAAELGHVAVRLPDPGCGDDAIGRALIDASAEFGDIAAEVRDATRDGAIVPAERDRIVAQIDEALASLTRMRAVVTGPAVRIVSGEGEAAA